MSIKFYKYLNLPLVQNKLNSDITADDIIYSKDGNLVLDKVIYKLVPQVNKDDSGNYKEGQCLITKSDGTIEWGDVSVDDELTETSTNPVSSKAIYKVVVDNEQVVAAALNDLNTRVAKQEENGVKIWNSLDAIDCSNTGIKAGDIIYLNPYTYSVVFWDYENKNGLVVSNEDNQQILKVLQCTQNNTVTMSDAINLSTVKTSLDNKVDKDGSKKLSTNDYTNSDKNIVQSHELLYDYIHCASVSEIPKNGTSYVDGKYLVDENNSGVTNSYYTVVAGGSIVNEVAVPEGTKYYLKNGEIWESQEQLSWKSVRHWETLTFYLAMGGVITKKVLVND